MPTIKTVPGFTPSTSGFHFSNSFPSVPLLTINVLGQNIAIGDASNGLCGGMVFAVRDFFEAKIPMWPDTTAPASGTLFDYIVKRLFDSFDLVLPPPPPPPPFITPTPPFGPGPATYMWLMDPALPDHETVASNTLVAPHGRAWVMIVEEWPKIQADIDNGVLSPIALVELKSLDPMQMGKNHQVLAWGYKLDGTDLTIHVYDPNYPDNNTVSLSLSIADPQHTTAVTYSTGETIWCFFRSLYSFVSPPPPPQPQSRCFIATAAYGSSLAPEVDFLRHFRDNIIRKTRSGAEYYDRFYEQYYRVSPPIADLMRQDEQLREVLGWSLVTPLVNYFQLALRFPTTDVDEEIETMQEPWKSFLTEFRDGLEKWAGSIELPYDFNHLAAIDAAEEIRIVMSYLLRRSQTRNTYLDRLGELGQIPLKATSDERREIVDMLRSSGRSDAEIQRIIGVDASLQDGSTHLA